MAFFTQHYGCGIHPCCLDSYILFVLIVTVYSIPLCQLVTESKLMPLTSHANKSRDRYWVKERNRIQKASRLRRGQTNILKHHHNSGLLASFMLRRGGATGGASHPGTSTVPGELRNSTSLVSCLLPT